MPVKVSTYQKDVIKEIKTIPPEYLPYLLQIVRAYKEAILLKSTIGSSDNIETLQN